MLFPLFILELLATIVTVEQFFVELLFHKSIYVLAKVNIITAIRTLTASVLPFSYACGTSQLITLQAFLRILDNLEAYETTEVVIKSLYSIVGLQVLIIFD